MRRSFRQALVERLHAQVADPTRQHLTPVDAALTVALILGAMLCAWGGVVSHHGWVAGSFVLLAAAALAQARFIPRRSISPQSSGKALTWTESRIEHAYATQQARAAEREAALLAYRTPRPVNSQPVRRI